MMQREKHQLNKLLGDTSNNTSRYRVNEFKYDIRVIAPHFCQPFATVYLNVVVAGHASGIQSRPRYVRLLG
ncbi:hypothetical protein TNCV_1103631 [Trichonephila clavipes]|nr:hypothetical protein TNCV_1103631 [Trichonephila clavipes]